MTWRARWTFHTAIEVTRCGDAREPRRVLEPAETARTMRGNADVAVTLDEDERDHPCQAISCDA